MPVGVKPGECDRKREAAGREMKGCVEGEEKGNGDNEKSDLGSPAPTDPFHIRTFAESMDTPASNAGSLRVPAENAMLGSKLELK